MEFRKMVTMTSPICEATKETDVKNRLLEYVGEGEGGMI